MYKVKSVHRRSKSGLASADRTIESANQDLSNVLFILNQKLSQKASILKLIKSANRTLVSEKKEKERAEQDIKSANNDEQKQSLQIRLHSILERISDIQFETKNREKTIKKLDGQINTRSLSKNRISDKIKKTSQTKPELDRLLKSSEKDAKKLSDGLARCIKQETLVINTLKKTRVKVRDSSSSFTNKQTRTTKNNFKSKRITTKKPAKKIIDKSTTAKKTTKKPTKIATSKRTTTKKTTRRTRNDNHT